MTGAYSPSGNTQIMRYFIYLSYCGLNYHGWQVQPNAISVQGELDHALSVLLREDIHTTGAGRTDAGVSARMMVAHFDTSAEFEPAQLVYKLNRFLSPDIAVQEVCKVAPTAHARFDALSRTYHYYIYKDKDPFRSAFAARFAYPLDFEKMNAAAQLLLDVRDFTSFSKTHTDVKTNICHVTHAEWLEVEEGLWRFEITADRFLRNMVRAVVGTLIEVGRGRMMLDGFRAVIDKKDRCAAADSVPGNALYLVDVKYPETIYTTMGECHGKGGEENIQQPQEED